MSQKLYKLVISIDFAPQTTSLEFIRKSLELVFEKIAREYDEFIENCYGTEPQVYVTCLLWNMAYFYSARNHQTQPHSTYQYQLDDSMSAVSNVPHTAAPFTIIAHSKRLLKSNINEMARYLFAKINESKTVIIESFMNSRGSEANNYAR